MLEYTPFILVISAPSGTGKTTIIKEVVKRDKKLYYSVSATSRKRRKGEKNRRDYIFLTEEEFEKWIKEERLLEWTRIYNAYYGTPKLPILKALDGGKDVITDLDIKGLKNLKKEFKKRVVSVFLTPPDIQSLRSRLLKREGISSEDSISSQLKLRMELAEKELNWKESYDYWVINDKINLTVKRILWIIRAERMRKERIRL